MAGDCAAEGTHAHTHTRARACLASFRTHRHNHTQVRAHVSVRAHTVCGVIELLRAHARTHTYACARARVCAHAPTRTRGGVRQCVCARARTGCSGRGLRWHGVRPLAPGGGGEGLQSGCPSFGHGLRCLASTSPRRAHQDLATPQSQREPYSRLNTIPSLGAPFASAPGLPSGHAGTAPARRDGIDQRAPMSCPSVSADTDAESNVTPPRCGPPTTAAIPARPTTTSR